MSRTASTLVLIVGLVLLTLAVRWVAADDAGEAAPPQRPPYVLPVTLGEVERGTLSPRALLTGSVRALERASFGFRLPGRLAELGPLAGDRVAAGALLARLEDGDQRAQLARAQAALELAQRELALAEAGERVEDVLRLEAELEQRRAEAELAQSEVARNRELLGTSVIAQSTYDALVAASKAAVARVAAAEQTLARARSGRRPEELAIARAQVALRQAEVEIARTELAKTELFAPFEAHVLARLASPGETVAAGSPIYELVDLSRREIELEVPSTVAVRLRPGARAILRLDEAPDVTLELAIDALLAAADEDSRNFEALVRLSREQDPEGRFKPGLFVRADVELAPLVDALLLPEDALRVVDAGTIVVRAAHAQGGALAGEWVRVRVLGTHAGRAAVEALEGTLAAGERVVLTGVDLAFPGVPLLPAAPQDAEHAP
jgi:HlyD family secretion protein